MARLTKKQFEDYLETLSSRTGLALKAVYWNGVVHIYNKENNVIMMSGNMRKCYDYITAFHTALTHIEELKSKGNISI